MCIFDGTTELTSSSQTILCVIIFYRDIYRRKKYISNRSFEKKLKYVESLFSSLYLCTELFAMCSKW